MNIQFLYDNNIDTIVTFQTFEHKQKYVRKGESRKNASSKTPKHKQHMNVGERRDCKQAYSKQGYKQAYKAERDAKRMNWESV